MKKLLQIKFFLFSAFFFGKEMFSHSSFFCLGHMMDMSAGGILPLQYQTDSCYRKKDFDEVLHKIGKYGVQASNIANFFINKYKTELPSDVSSKKLLNDIIC